jgi:hypothetical protein
VLEFSRKMDELIRRDAQAVLYPWAQEIEEAMKPWSSDVIHRPETIRHIVMPEGVKDPRDCPECGRPLEFEEKPWPDFVFAEYTAPDPRRTFYDPSLEDLRWLQLYKHRYKLRESVRPMLAPKVLL